MREVDLKTHPLKGVSLIEASAGTGKTFTIGHLYLRYLLETEYNVEQLLVVTFTNAATQELKGRIRKLTYQLRNYLQGDEEHSEVLEQLFQAYRQDRQAISRLQKALINFDEASIYSIHGFCQRVLMRFPVETLSLLQQDIIADEMDMRRAAIRDYWRRNIIGLDLPRLEWIQDNWKGPDELLQDVMPLLHISDNILEQAQQPLAFDDQLEQLWQRLLDYWQCDAEQIKTVLLDNPSLNRRSVQPATVNILLQQLETLFTAPLPYRLPAKWELITRDKLKLCLKKNCEDARLEDPFFICAGEFQALHQQWVRQHKIELLLDVAESINKRIDEVKKNALNISFDDLITRLSRVLQSPDNGLVQKITQQYPVAMVDEFQDTDYRQYFIFNTLYQQQPDKSLILIGDPKQAIYSFRGADIFTYQQARSHTPQCYTLETNYRSSKHYIDVVNRVFGKHKNAFVIDQLIEYFPAGFNAQHSKSLTQHGKPVEALVTWQYPFSVKPVSKSIAQDYFARTCAQEIEQILTGKELQIDAQPVQAKDLAILVKTGRQAGLMKQQLARLGIGSALVLRDSVFASDQAREITLLLRVLIEPSNIRLMNGLLSSDLFGWNAAQIFQLQTDNKLLVETLEQIREYRLHWQQKGILSTFFLLLKQQQTLQKNSMHMDGERRITNWLHIVELLQQQAREHASPGQAMHWLLKQRSSAHQTADNEEHQLRLESDSNLVRIVTIHKSKGLQYPIVFLPFMWDVKSARNQPKSYSVHDTGGRKRTMIYDEGERSRWHQENLAEEVRLFYVAMTRAEYRCYLAWGNIKGAGSSAIAHCLYHQYIKQGSYPNDLELENSQSLRLPFDNMNRDEKRVQIVEPRVETSPAARRISQKVPLTRAQTFSRKVDRQWRISSYSQIALGGTSDNSDRPDYDELMSLPDLNDQEQPATELSRFTFQKGAKAGNFLHEIMEHQPFDQAVDAILIQQKSQDYGFNQQWQACLCEWIEDVLNCPLTGFSLCDLKPQQKVSEMEFYMNCHDLQPRRLNELLHKHNYSLPGQSFSFADISGFIKGFIDLVFEFDGRYFIADYKSNYLGPAMQYYTQDACQQAMFDHHYHLQYLIYSVALHRYLQQRIPDYDYQQHFGGVYYLFLRGMSATDHENHGVFFHRPQAAVIESLNNMFAGA